MARITLDHLAHAYGPNPQGPQDLVEHQGVAGVEIGGHRRAGLEPAHAGDQRDQAALAGIDVNVARR
jgi:hypothetical protein